MRKARRRRVGFASCAAIETSEDVVEPFQGARHLEIGGLRAELIATGRAPAPPDRRRAAHPLGQCGHLLGEPEKLINAELLRLARNSENGVVVLETHHAPDRPIQRVASWKVIIVFTVKVEGQLLRASIVARPHGDMAAVLQYSADVNGAQRARARTEGPGMAALMMPVAGDPLRANEIAVLTDKVLRDQRRTRAGVFLMVVVLAHLGGACGHAEGGGVRWSP